MGSSRISSQVTEFQRMRQQFKGCSSELREGKGLKKVQKYLNSVDVAERLGREGKGINEGEKRH